MRFDIVLRNLPRLFDALAQTWLITGVSLALGFAVALVVVALRLTKSRTLSLVTQGYIEVFRNTPAVAQLFLIYFGLPSLGIRVDALTAALVALTLNHGAYLAEILRAGVESVEKVQWEAAYSLGMRFTQVLRRVVYPIALRAAYPALCNQAILGLLWVSLVSVIGARELVYEASILNAITFRTFEIYLVVGLIYLANVLAFSAFLKGLGVLFLGTAGSARLPRWALRAAATVAQMQRRHLEVRE